MMAHTDKAGRRMASLYLKIGDALLDPPANPAFWDRRWLSIVEQYAEMVDQGVWEIWDGPNLVRRAEQCKRTYGAAA